MTSSRAVWVLGPLRGVGDGRGNCGDTEEIQSDGDSSSDDWSSLADIKISHLSDYCMRALYCRVVLSVNTALSNYTMYWPESTQHCLIAETDVIHSHPPQAVRLPRLSVCDNS